MVRHDIPDLLRYQLIDGPHAGEPTTERGEIERLARECRVAACQVGLDSTVVETRFNVVRSSLPAVVTMARRLRDYLPPVDRDGLTQQAKRSLRDGEPAVPPRGAVAHARSEVSGSRPRIMSNERSAGPA